jgi:methylated-DNA-[protein]-cysteine S-methyltransferase
MQKIFSKKRTILFSVKVYEVVKKIPRGKVLTYKDVAKLAGSPRAFRAVGNVLNKNSDLKNIPCHRVIKSDGKIGGYKFGAKRKASLLKREGVVVKKGRVDL